MKFVISISIFFLVPSLFCQTSSDALKKEQKKIEKKKRFSQYIFLVWVVVLNKNRKKY
jgi:hypothetical protein